MADAHLSAQSVQYLAECLAHHRPIDLPAKGYWGPRSLAALAAAALAMLRRGAWPLTTDEQLIEEYGTELEATDVEPQHSFLETDAESVNRMIEEQWGQKFFGPSPCEQNIAALNRYLEPQPGARRIL